MEYHLKAATLNFGGVNISPFEYHDGSQEKSHLDEQFTQIFEECKEQKWSIAKLDKVFQRGRYSLLYHHGCGVVRGRLINRGQFQVLWDKAFDDFEGNIQRHELQEENTDRLRTFDWLVYKAFLHFLYGEVEMDRLGQYNVSRYMKELKKWHEKGYLNADTKINHVREYILKQELDVLFLQQALTHRASEYLPSNKYEFVTRNDSMIVYKKEKYLIQDEKDAQEFHLTYGHKLDFNHDSCYFKTKNLLLLSVHLSSKKVHREQAKDMVLTLEAIAKENKDLVIIMGIDANHLLEQHSYFRIYPDSQLATTRKKRTSMQCQFDKAERLVEETKDHIVTNLTITSSRVETIRSWDASQNLLPNDDHPFDHFLINANLEFDKPVYRAKVKTPTPIKICLNLFKTEKTETTEENIDPGHEKLGQTFVARSITEIDPHLDSRQRSHTFNPPVFFQSGIKVPPISIVNVQTLHLPPTKPCPFSSLSPIPSPRPSPTKASFFPSPFRGPVRQ